MHREASFLKSKINKYVILSTITFKSDFRQSFRNTITQLLFFLFKTNENTILDVLMFKKLVFANKYVMHHVLPVREVANGNKLNVYLKPIVIYYVTIY